MRLRPVGRSFPTFCVRAGFAVSPDGRRPAPGDTTRLRSHGRRAYVFVRPSRELHVIDLSSGRSTRVTKARWQQLPALLGPAR